MRDLLDRLVRAPTEGPAGGEREAVVDLLCGTLRMLGLTPHLITVPASTLPRQPASVVASYGEGESTVYLHGRYRAMPAADPRQFPPWWEGETFFGRGTADMTGGIVSMLFALKALRELDTPLVGRVVVVLVPGDDESEARRATRQLVDLGVIGGRGVAMYTPQPTAGTIWNASRGVIRLRVTIRSAEGLDWSSRGALDASAAALPVLQQLFDLRQRVTARQTAYVLLPGPAKRSVLVIGGEVDGGIRFEALPGVCRFSVERRLNPEESFEDEKRELLNVFEQASRDGIDCDVEIVEEGRPSGVPSTSTAAVSLERAICKIRQRLPTFALYPRLLDTQFYAQGGVPGLAYGPGHAAATAGMREFIKMESVMEYAAIYAMSIVHLVGDPMVDPWPYL